MSFLKMPVSTAVFTVRMSKIFEQTAADLRRDIAAKKANWAY